MIEKKNRTRGRITRTQARARCALQSLLPCGYLLLAEQPGSVEEAPRGHRPPADPGLPHNGARQAAQRAQAEGRRR